MQSPMPVNRRFTTCFIDVYDYVDKGVAPSRQQAIP